MTKPLLQELLTRRPTREEAHRIGESAILGDLLAVASELRDRGHGDLVTYSRKVFIPLTHLCRDICHYCVFAQPPRRGEAAYMSLDAVLDVARKGAEAGCKEALFTLGDKPELRWRVARNGLEALGQESTLTYLAEAAQVVFEETGLLPHLNPGLLDADDFAALRPWAPSMGIMLESVSERLLEKGEAHYGCPDKEPAARLETLRLAGEAQVPFTSGILIGIGETRAERLDALLALRALNDEYGHIQEIIVQNFRAKTRTRMQDAPEPDLDDLAWTIAMARVIFGPAGNIQVPPNLSEPESLSTLVAAGINDWGGVSPVTPDFVNPEAPWPHLDRLGELTSDCGKTLHERLTIYPEYAMEPERWLDERMVTPVLQRIDSDGLARSESWSPGEADPPPTDVVRRITARPSSDPHRVDSILERARDGQRLEKAAIATLFRARGEDFTRICRAANDLRIATNGDTVTYVVNRNINYTNICYFKCQFCAFSKGKLSENLRGKPYDLSLDEIARRTSEAWERGATEVCMQGGIHPAYTGQNYLDILDAVKGAVPGIHVHAFSPLEVWQGAATLDMPLRDFLSALRDHGLGTLPGTAAEVLDDEVREILCADKIRSDQWLEVMETAHGLGLKTTSTIMYGHVDGPENWATHLLRLRDLQERTGGFTEFVPLPFVHMEAPIYLKGNARRGPTFREAVLMHAVARLALHPVIPNIQTSWVKMGREGVAACLNAGVNDLGVTLMNESITRAAGTQHGQELPPPEMEDLIRSLDRTPQQRSTPYGTPPAAQVERSFDAAPLTAPNNTPAHRYERSGPLRLIRPGLEIADETSA
ncbi:MAG: 5-amino-6-(D-ribitylamino)uracil--L-tyrosine 4-hydroxyphenyl transferase CofH [Acidobacteriota bacterium]